MDIYFDTETTELDPERDEILTLSVVDGEGGVLWDRAYRPTRVAECPEAEAVNGISPADVAACPAISEDVVALREIFGGADSVVGYNVGFDLGFLAAAGVTPPESCEVHDTMRDFAELYGEVDLARHDWRRKRLAFAADHIGHDWEGREAHGSLADALATLDVQRWCDERRREHEDDVAALRKDGTLRTVPRANATIDELWLSCCALCCCPFDASEAEAAELEAKARKMALDVPSDVEVFKREFERCVSAFVSGCEDHGMSEAVGASFMRVAIWNRNHAIASAAGVSAAV